MRDLKDLFFKRKIDYDKLIDYGFVKEDKTYILRTNIIGGDFEVEIRISDNEKTSRVIDLVSNMEYVLVDVEDAVRKFCWTGKV